MHQRGGVFDVSWPYANRAKNFGTMHVLKTLIFAGSKQHHAAVFTHNFPRRPTKVIFVARTGTPILVETDNGRSVMQVALDNMIPGIRGERGGSCMCASCHAYIDQTWVAKVGRPSE